MCSENGTSAPCNHTVKHAAAAEYKDKARQERACDASAKNSSAFFIMYTLLLKVP
jgi:hypothetical protein